MAPCSARRSPSGFCSRKLAISVVVTSFNTASATGPELDPDSTTDPKDRLAGTGLGLSIVRTLANARGGTLLASHAPEGGAAMILTFPLDSHGVVGPFVTRVASAATPMPPALPIGRRATARLGGPGVARS